MTALAVKFRFLAFVALLPAMSSIAAAAPLVESLGCGACHLGFANASEAIAATPSLSGLSERFATEQLIAYLVDTPVSDKPTRMPDYGFDREEAAAIAAHLLGEDSALAKRGAQMVAAQRCLACHVEQPAPIVAAPFINTERHRVTDTWLQDFLAQPKPIRPLGHPVGSGGRMPDFHLSPDEVNSVFASFNAPPVKPEVQSGERDRLSPYAMQKAQRLISERYNCLGCHQLGSKGGRIGPDLSALQNRLRPAYVAAILRDPQAVAPGTIMPRQRMPEHYAELVTAFLNQQMLPSVASTVATQWSPLPIDMQSSYAQYCAVCHGQDGAGDGPNAPYLKPAPVALSDANKMKQRPDDTLFDGIHAGGRILDVSHHMPAWGQTLSAKQISGLVEHIRKLCDCEGPLWSRDEKQAAAQ